MTGSTLTVQLSDADKARLGSLAKATGRSESSLAAEAVSEYLSVQDWQVAAIHAAMESLDRGEWVPHSAVRDWVESWGTDRELQPPKPTRG
jgi:RHH-type transcriptional regulator, rel operon repressor / antitoxin RelB